MPGRKTLHTALVHNLDGWEPLCAHLDVPMPGQPYPTRNHREFPEREPEQGAVVSLNGEE